MRGASGLVGGILLLALSLWFATANGVQRVRVDLGFVTLYRVPLAVVVFLSLLLGMTIMFLVGVQTDLKVRRLLRERLRAEDQEERQRVDRNQRDLFGPEET